MKERPYFDRVNSVFVLHRIEHDIQPDISLIRSRGVSSSSGTWRCDYFFYWCRVGFCGSAERIKDIGERNSEITVIRFYCSVHGQSIRG